jgi:hypothetical protein
MNHLLLCGEGSSPGHQNAYRGEETSISLNVLFLQHYNHMMALAFLMILLYRSLSCVFLHHAVTLELSGLLIKHQATLILVFLSPYCLLARRVVFLQGALSTILCVCPSHCNAAVSIIFIMLASLYTLHISSLYFILHILLKQLGSYIFLEVVLLNILSFSSSAYVQVHLSHPLSTTVKVLDQ